MTTTNVGKLTQDELNEVLIRHQAVMNAKASYLMMQRGYHEYVKETLATYRHNAKDNLQIDLRTGDVRLVTDVESQVANLQAISSSVEEILPTVGDGVEPEESAS